MYPFLFSCNQEQISQIEGWTGGVSITSLNPATFEPKPLRVKQSIHFHVEEAPKPFASKLFSAFTKVQESTPHINYVFDVVAYRSSFRLGEPYFFIFLNFFLLNPSEWTRPIKIIIIYFFLFLFYFF